MRLLLPRDTAAAVTVAHRTKRTGNTTSVTDQVRCANLRLMFNQYVSDSCQVIEHSQKGDKVLVPSLNDRHRGAQLRHLQEVYTEEKNEVQAALTGHHARRQALLAALRGQGLRVLTRPVISRKKLLVGHGEPSVYDTGMTLHHTLGVPYLPGSALKGLTRHWLTALAAGGEALDGFSAEALTALVTQLFGAGGDDAHAAAGLAVFFDALPLAPPTLSLSGQTPHYGPYYAETPDTPDPKRPPADWYKPVPFSYLVLKSGVKFDLHLAVRRHATWDDAQYAHAVDSLGQWVTRALDAWGIGGKTRRGFGKCRERTT